MVLGLQIPEDYKPSAGELDNIVYLTLKYSVGWPMRRADLQVCLSMAGGVDAIVGDAGISKLVEVTCEYAWDHICGEPDEFTSEQLFNHLQPIFREWYATTTPEVRAKTD